MSYLSFVDVIISNYLCIQLLFDRMSAHFMPIIAKQSDKAGEFAYIVLLQLQSNQNMQT